MTTLLSRLEAFSTSRLSALAPPTSASAPGTAWTAVRARSTVSNAACDVARLVLSAVVPFAGLASAGWIARRRHAR